MIDATLGSTLLSDLLWFVIFVGWVVLLFVGLEPDKPLSGGIPGHVDLAETHHQPPPEGLFGRLGEIGGWVGFALASLSLIAVTVWIFRMHS